MDIRQFLFSFKGRIGRGDFWLLMLTIVAIITVAVIVGYLVPIQPIKALVGICLFVGALVVFFAAAVRRLHDRNKSAWFLLLFYGLPTALQSTHKGDGGFTLFLFSGGFNSFIDIICLAISVWMIIELGCLRGNVGANQYGPDPLEPMSAPVDAA